MDCESQNNNGRQGAHRGEAQLSWRSALSAFWAYVLLFAVGVLLEYKRYDPWVSEFFVFAAVTMLWTAVYCYLKVWTVNRSGTKKLVCFAAYAVIATYHMFAYVLGLLPRI